MYTQHLERSSALQGRWAVEALGDSGKLRYTEAGRWDCHRSQALPPGPDHLQHWTWNPMGPFGSKADLSPTHEQVIRSLISREGGGSYRTRLGRREEPIYFLPSHFYHPPFRSAAPSCIFRDPSWAIFLGTVEIS